MKLKKIQIAKNMNITKGAVRKLIPKDKENLKKLRQQEIKEEKAEIVKIQEKIKIMLFYCLHGEYQATMFQEIVV